MLFKRGCSQGDGSLSVYALSLSAAAHLANVALPFDSGSHFRHRRLTSDPYPSSPVTLSRRSCHWSFDSHKQIALPLFGRARYTIAYYIPSMIVLLLQSEKGILTSPLSSWQGAAGEASRASSRGPRRPAEHRAFNTLKDDIVL